nr:hypothetical protein B0A51_09875 [Rachicladosporium sp. CCFEE 5018]
MSLPTMDPVRDSKPIRHFPAIFPSLRQVSRVLHPKVLFAWENSVQYRASNTSWLDGLRGIAALQVYFFHFFGLHTHWGNPYGATPEDVYIHQLPLFRGIWAAGSAAVCIFFVISGFAITIKCLTLLRKGQHLACYESLASSLIRRGFRLYLPVVLVGIPGFFLMRTVDMVEAGTFSFEFERKNSTIEQLLDFVHRTDAHISPFTYAETHEFRDRYPYAPSAWTIPMEYYGSIVSYLTILFVSRIPAFKLRCAVIGFSSLYALHRGCWWASLFLNGMLLAEVMLEQRHRAAMSEKHAAPTSRARHIFYQIPFVLMFAFGYYMGGVPPKVLPFDFHPIPRVGYQWLYTLYPPFWMFEMQEDTRWLWYWSGMFIIIGISQVPWLRRVPESTFCQWLGKLSFSLYLVHPAIIAVLKPHLDRFIDGSGAGKGVKCAFDFITLTPICFIVAAVTERWIDQPSVTFARWFEKRITRQETEKSIELPLGRQLEMEEQAPLVERIWPEEEEGKESSDALLGSPGSSQRRASHDRIS